MIQQLLRSWRHGRGYRRCRSQLGRLQLLVLDVDGVLTDGGLWTTETGEVLVNNGKSHTREQFKEMVKRLEKAEESDRVSVTARPKGGYDLHVGELTIPWIAPS